MKLAIPSPIKRLLNAFPDVNEHPAEQQATLGLVVSVMLHMGVFVLWLGAQSGWLDNLLLSSKKPAPPVDIVIQVLDPVVKERVVVPLDQLKEPPRVDSTGLKESATEKTSGLFQSDKNLEAGSEQRSSGSAPVPTIKGRLSEAERVLVKQESKVGVLDAQVAKAVQALSKLANTKSGGKAAVAAKKPAQKYQPGDDLPRMEDLPELNGELVFRRLASGPSTSNKSGGVAEEEPAPPAPSPKPKPLSEAETIDDLFQEGKEKSESKGGLAQNGKLGVDAVKTLLGDYQKSVGKMVGMPWNKLVKERMDTLESGLVKVHLWIAMDGTLRKATVERTTSNKAFSDLCLEALKKARLAPLPSELQATLHDGVLEMFYTFNLY